MFANLEDIWQIVTSIRMLKKRLGSRLDAINLTTPPGRYDFSTQARLPYIPIPALLKMAKKQKFPHLVGSKWTAQQETWGWRHFQVVNRKNQGQWVFAELVAACDPSVRFWMNAQPLKDRSQWQAGWQPLQSLRPDQVSDQKT